MSFVTGDEFSVRVTKNYFKDWRLMNSQSTFLFLTYLNLMNYVILDNIRFTNIRDLRSSFVDCESALELNSPDVFALCETNLDDSIDSSNFYVKNFL